MPAAARGKAVVLVDPTPYRAGDPLGIDRAFRPADGDLWLGLIDLEPDLNWEHEALAVLVGADGTAEVRPVRVPPALPEGHRWERVDGSVR